MKQKAFKKILVLMIFFVFLNFQSANAQENDMQDIMVGLTETLDLSDKQVAQIQSLLIQYRAKLDGVLLKHEDAEEPDVGGMIGEIREVRDAYRKDLKGILSKDQYNIYLAQIDSILTDMFNDLAEIRLMDLQPDTDMTDEQLESLVPVVGKSLKSIVQLLFENAGTRLSIPKKIKIGKNIKKIEKEKRSAMENILTPDQMAKYDAFKEEQKKEKKKK